MRNDLKFHLNLSDVHATGNKIHCKSSRLASPSHNCFKTFFFGLTLNCERVDKVSANCYFLCIFISFIFSILLLLYCSQLDLSSCQPSVVWLTVWYVHFKIFDTRFCLLLWKGMTDFYVIHICNTIDISFKLLHVNYSMFCLFHCSVKDWCNYCRLNVFFRMSFSFLTFNIRQIMDEQQ